jgi:biopolymer transport protein ExbD
MRSRLQKNSSDSLQEPTINLTPLIDVVFVILISFIVIAPLLEMDKVQLAKGASFHSPVHCQDSSPIQIHVYADNSIAFNLRKISLHELPKLLSEAKRQNPNSRPQLFHDKKACFGTYQQIKNILESCGFGEMDVVLAPK